MSYTKPKMLDRSGIYILDDGEVHREINPDAPSAEDYTRLSNENRELRHELHNLRKDYMAAVEQIQELQTKMRDAYEPSVSPRDCAIGGEEDSNWT